MLLAATGSLGIGFVSCFISHFFENCYKFIQFLVFVAHDKFLFDGFVRNQTINFANIDLNRILQEIVSKPLDRFGPSRREKQSLSSCRNFFDDGPNLWLETLWKKKKKTLGTFA
jgi:hypothetical protein